MCGKAMVVMAINSLHSFIQQTFNEYHFMPSKILAPGFVRYINHDFCIRGVHCSMSHQIMNHYSLEWKV